MGIKFTKMQAFGNDYVYIDAIHQKLPDLNQLSRKLSERHFGIGSDGMVLVCPSEKGDFRMRIFNPDGTEAEMCGNALRSTAKFIYDHGFSKQENLTIETLGGLQRVHLHVEGGRVANITAAIGKPVLDASKVPVDTGLEQFFHQPLLAGDRVFMASSLSWGNPHTVLLVEDLDTLDIGKYGPLVENHRLFPKRTNVTFAQAVDDSHIRIREWERGTGETIGCGTGCCSAVVVLNMLGLCGRVADVAQIGGVLHVEWDEQDIVRMTGPSYVVYEGEYVDEAGETFI